MRKPKGLYKRGRIWWIGIKGPEGKPYFGSTGTSDMRQAEAVLVQRKREIKEGKLKLAATATFTFEQLAREYLIWAQRQKSYKSKQCRMRQLVRLFGRLPLEVFTTRMVEQYQTERLKVNKPATVNRNLALLKHMFSKAVEWNLVGEEVLKNIRKVKLLPENNRRLRFLSQEECQALVDACSSHLRPIMICAIHTGMRKSEILQLRWSQIDFVHDYIFLETTKNGEVRQIPISPTLSTVLKGLPKGPESIYVFANKKGEPYKWLSKSLKYALSRAGIGGDVTFHTLRHTFASHLVMGGADLTTVGQLMGHKSLSMTLRYSHLSPQHKTRAIGILENRLGLTEEVEQQGVAGV